MARHPSLRWLRFLGLALLAGLIWYAERKYPRQLWKAALNTSPAWLLLAWALNFPQLGLKAYRWHLLVRWQGMKLSYPRALLSYFGSLLVGFLTPGRLGEMAKAFTLRNECGAPLAAAMSSVVVDRIFDMYLLLLFGALGVVRFSIIGSRLSWPAFAIGCAVLALPIFFMHGGTVRRAARILARWAPARRREWLLAKADQYAGGLDALSFTRLLTCAALTVASYSIFFFQCLCCAWALGFTMRVTDLVLLQSATNFISFLPIAPAGLGAREASLVFFLARIQPAQPEPVAILYGLTIFLVFFVGGGLIGFLSWQWAPIGMHTAAREIRERNSVHESRESHE